MTDTDGRQELLEALRVSRFRAMAAGDGWDVADVLAVLDRHAASQSRPERQHRGHVHGDGHCTGLGLEYQRPDGSTYLWDCLLLPGSPLDRDTPTRRPAP